MVWLQLSADDAARRAVRRTARARFERHSPIQQTPFVITADLESVFRERLTASLANWDMRDGVADWTPAALAANVNVFLDDFLLFDVAKPMTDTSHLRDRKEHDQRTSLIRLEADARSMQTSSTF